MPRVARRYGGGCVDLWVGPFMVSLIYRRNAGYFGWRENWSALRIWLAKHGLVFGRWNEKEYF